MKPLAIALATIGLAGAAITPATADDTARITVEVKTVGIDLVTPEGQRLLDQRIEKAARTVCRTDQWVTGSRILTYDARKCLAQAHSDARQQVAALVAKQQPRGA